MPIARDPLVEAVVVVAVDEAVVLVVAPDPYADLPFYTPFTDPSIQDGTVAAPATDLAENPLPLTDVTAETNKQAAPSADAKSRAPRPPKQRGPPEDGIPSTTKVMVANLPYDLSEDKVRAL